MSRKVIVELPFLDNALSTLFKKKKKDIEGKIKQVIINSILEAGEKEQKEWIANVKKALSDKLSLNLLHKKRPDRNRKFPYLVTGDLQRKVKANVSLKSLAKNSATFKWWFGLMSDHATYTTNAINSDDNPSWKGWANRVFVSSDDNNIPSAQYIITMFFAYKLENYLKGKF